MLLSYVCLCMAVALNACVCLRPVALNSNVEVGSSVQLCLRALRR